MTSPSNEKPPLPCVSIACVWRRDKQAQNEIGREEKRKLEADYHRRSLPYDHQSVVVCACFTNFGEQGKCKEVREKISPVIIPPRNNFCHHFDIFLSVLFLYVLKSFSPCYSVLNFFVQHNKHFPQFIKNFTNVWENILSRRFTPLSPYLSDEWIASTSCHCVISCSRWTYLYVDFFLLFMWLS